MMNGGLMSVNLGLVPDHGQESERDCMIKGGHKWAP